MDSIGQVAWRSGGDAAGGLGTTGRDVKGLEATRRPGGSRGRPPGLFDVERKGPEAAYAPRSGLKFSLVRAGLVSAKVLAGRCSRRYRGPG